MQTLEGKNALVTGGAQGVGLGVALALARNGAKVVIGDLDYEKAQIAAKKISSVGNKALALQIDVTEEKSAKIAIQKMISDFGGIDILVNNAGVMQKGLDELTTEADFDTCYNVNLKAVWILVHSVRSHFKEKKYGKVINIASVAGRRGGGDLPAYCASKAAVISLTQSLSESLSRYNVNVNALCPGLVWTDMWVQLEGMWGDENLIDERPVFNNLVNNTPLGRAVTPEDIGAAAVFLASDAARNITGQSLNIDGGLVLN